MIVPLVNSAAYLIALGRYDEARRRTREGLARSRDLQTEVHTAIAIQHLAAIGAGSGAYDRSARLLGFCDARFTALEAVREFTEALEHQKAMSMLREHLDDVTLARLMDEGRIWDEDQAVAEALLI